MSKYLGAARYEYYGKTIHLRFRSLRDLKHVLRLNEVFWLATTAPIGDFLLPESFLKKVDSDGDGRIRVEELKSAIRWLQEHSVLEEPEQTLKREHLKTDELKAKWDKVAEAFELAPEVALSLEQIEELRELFLEEPSSYGAGSLAPEEVEDEDQRALLATISEAVLPEKEAVTEEQLDRFLEMAQELTDWREASPGENVWADEYPVFQALNEQLKRYFELADAARFTGDEPVLSWPEGEVEAGLQELPLAWPLNPDGISFKDRVNPAFRSEVQAFEQTFLKRGATLKRERYEELRERFGTYSEWLEQAPDTPLKKLSSDELRGWLGNTELLELVRGVLREKREEGLVQQDFCELEKLLLFQAYLLKFCQNFVAFHDLYDPKERAPFERGTLIMDGREFHLALPVDDLEKHKAAATRSNMFVLYIQVCDEILAVPVTSGSKGNLAKGKRGVFHHVDGEEKEAQVIDLVVNPISLLEAVMAPFEKLGQALQRRIEASSEEHEKQLVERGSGAGSKTSGSFVAGGGIAVAALGSSGAFILKTLASLSVPSIIFGLIGLLAILLAPIVVVAYLKLRSRDLSAVLEGNAWGINARMKLTPIQARQFTQAPRHPGYVGSSMSVILVIGLVVLAGCLAYFFRDEILLLLGL